MKKHCQILLLLLIANCFQSYAQWSDVGQGANSRVRAFCVDTLNDVMYIGGSFSVAGGNNINNIGIWNGSAWSSFGSNEAFSSPRYINSIVEYNGDIIVAGDFDSIGNHRVNNIAKWNGVTWEPISNGFDDAVFDLIIYNGDLYACGLFTYSDTSYVGCVAKFNGNTWEGVGHLIGYATALTVFHNKLIIGGSFFDQYISSIYGIAGWDGVALDSSFGQFNNYIFKLRVYDDTMYAVGSFTSIPSNPCNYISVFYNNSWHCIGNPTGGTNWVKDIIKYHNKIYFCGYFTHPPDICVYNGSGFDSLGQALGYLESFAEFNNELYIGGLFIDINGIPFNNIVRYDNLQNNIVHYESKNNECISIFPNPTIDGKITIDVCREYNASLKLKLYNSFGKTIWENPINSITNKLILPTGIYYLRIYNNNIEYCIKKIVVI